MFKTELIIELLDTEQPPLADVLDAITATSTPSGTIKEIDYLINLLRTAMQYQHLHDSAVYVYDCAIRPRVGDEKTSSGPVRSKISPPLAILSALSCEPIRQITPDPSDVVPGGKKGKQRTHWMNDVLINSMAYNPRHLENVIGHPYPPEIFEGKLKDQTPPLRGFINPALTETIEILQAFKDDPNCGKHTEISDKRLSGVIAKDLPPDLVSKYGTRPTSKHSLPPTYGPAVNSGRLTRIPRRYGYFSNAHYQETGARKSTGAKNVRGDSMKYFEGALKWLQAKEVRLKGRYALTRYVTVPTETDFTPVDIRHALLYETLRYAQLANTRPSDVQVDIERDASARGISPAVVDTVVDGLMRIMMAEDTETVLWRAVRLRREIGRQIRFITSEYSQLSIATASRLQLTQMLAKDIISDETKSFVPKRIAAAPLVDSVELSRRDKVKDGSSDPHQAERNKEQQQDKYAQAAQGFSYDPASGVLTRTDTGKAIVGRSENVRFKGDNLYKPALVRYCIKNQGLLPDDYRHLPAEELSIQLINPHLPLPGRLAFSNMKLEYQAPTESNQQQQPTTQGLIRAHEDLQAAMKVEYNRHTGEIQYRELHNGRKIPYRRQVSVKGHQISYDRLIIVCIALNLEMRTTLRDTVIPDDFSQHNAHLMRLKMLPHSGDDLPTPDRFVIEVDPKFEHYYQVTKGQKLTPLSDLRAFRYYNKSHDIANAKVRYEPYADSGTDLDAFEEYLKKRQSLSDCPLV